MTFLGVSLLLSLPQAASSTAEVAAAIRLSLRMRGNLQGGRVVLAHQSGFPLFRENYV